MTEHIVSSYDDDLKEISDGVINMGDEVLGALNNIETLLKNNDHELAKKIIKNDLIINDLGQSVENKVFNILASRQPMAIDLRIVFSAVKISLYLERCGDMCKGISNRVLKGDLNEAQSPETISLLVNMCSMVHSNLGIVMEDYSKKECDNSVKVWKSDSEIDSLYSEILMDILNSIKTNPDATDALVPLLFIARYLERVGDQATNVAEETYFVVTGEDLEGLEKTEVENETTF
ncbi:MAG: phosphate signaling complex protein PhoU [Pseudomonadota bacterium]|jgi:phosphate transport system protein|nr:phosphate transport system regulatory protein PhoU [Woeseiaceae bacterium]MEC9097520.1 phosphate signaling complex protein PhoU [Pseudomonadota bacterium]|tara:strand:- start:503 stop:1204 length:702 start_codon:yes stop_codon:yes gene_type:complete